MFGLKGQDSFTLLEAYLEPVKNACPPQQVKSNAQLLREPYLAHEVMGDVVDGVDLLILPNAECGIRNAESLNASRLARSTAQSPTKGRGYEGTPANAE